MELNNKIECLNNNIIKIKHYTPREEKKTLDEKYGEIFITNSRELYINCCFCKNIYKNIKLFTNHLLKLHIDEPIKFLDDFLRQDVNEIRDELQENKECEEDYKSFEENESIEHCTEDSNVLLSNKLDINSILDKEVGLAKSKKNLRNKNKRYEKVELSVESDKTLIKVKPKNAIKGVNDYKLLKLPGRPKKSENDEKYQCNQCKTKYCRTRDVNRCEKRHKKEKCELKCYVCEICGKEFQLNSSLKIHLKRHSGDKPFACHLCPLRFIKKFRLDTHLRYHMNDRRFKCNYCDKRFIENEHRRLHERIHTGEMPYECETCKKKFRIKAKLNLHIKRHINDRNFECDICYKRFYDRTVLKGHMAVHSEEKPFECDECPAKFPRKGALRLHKQLHSDKKNYKCNICEKSFAQYNGIYSHMKTHGIKYSSTLKKQQQKEELITAQSQLDNNVEELEEKCCKKAGNNIKF